jgi:hypothetical protein
MRKRKKILLALALTLFVFSFSAAEISAKGDEAKSIARHLKTKYKAKKKKVPFMWLARFAVRTIRPAGVKSFSLTIYEDLKFSKETLDMEMQKAMRDSLGPEWTPVIRVRSRAGQQVYLYMREAGNNVRMMLVTIENNEAAVIRAKFNPEKLAEFIDDPKIFGISLGDSDDRKETDGKKSENDLENSENDSEKNASEVETSSPDEP